jgi:hypothetical protein
MLLSMLLSMLLCIHAAMDSMPQALKDPIINENAYHNNAAR